MPARALRQASLEELEERAEIEDQLLEPGRWEEDWKKNAQKQEFDFWDRVSSVPKHARNECLIYLYRLEPRVFNKPGEPSFTDKYPVPISIQEVQNDWGGGRYEVWLKRGKRTLAHHIFPLSGQPKYKEGQTDATGKALTASGGNAQPSNGAGSELAEALKALVPILKPEGGAKAAEAAVEVVRTGYTSVLDAQQKAASAPNELLARLAERALTPQPAPPGPDPLTMIDKLVSVANKLNGPQRNPEGNGNPIESLDAQMGLLEKVTGKAFSELIGMGEGKTPKVDPLVQFGITLVGALPTLFQQFRQFKVEEFQRQAYLASRTPPAQPAPIPTAPATEVQPPPSPNFEPPPAVPPLDNAPLQGVTQQQMVEMVIAEFCAYYKAGWDGYACATSLAVHFGESLQMLAPILSDRVELDKILETVPALKELESLAREAGQPTLTEFVDQFFDTLNPPQEEGEEDDDEAESLPVAKTRKKKKAEVQ